MTHTSITLPLLHTIQQNIEKLLTLHETLRKEKDELKERIAEMRQKLEQKDKEMSSLEEKNKILKIARSLSSTENSGAEKTTELKYKINEIVREVDKCIALLNS